MEARAVTYRDQIPQFCRSVDEKANMATCAAKGGLAHDES